MGQYVAIHQVNPASMFWKSGPLNTMLSKVSLQCLSMIDYDVQCYDIIT